MNFRNKLIYGVVVVLAVLTSIFIWDLTARQRKMFVDYQLDHSFALAKGLATASADWLLANDVAGLQELVDIEEEYPELQFAMLTGMDGRVFAHTDTSKVGLRVVDLPDMPKPSVLAQNSERIDVAVPVELNGSQIGWSRIGMDMSVTREHMATILRDGIVYALLTITIGAVVAWFMAYQLTRRLYIINDAIAKVKAGERSNRIAITGSDEVTTLAGDFNLMLDTLSLREQELKEANDVLGETVAKRTRQLEESYALVKKREEELKIAQHVAKIGSWLVDFKADSLTLSDESYNIFGITSGAPMDWDQFLARVHPEDLDMVVDAWAEALLNGSLEIEHRIMVDDAIKWVRELVEIRFSDNGELLQAIGTIQDISGLKENMLALSRSEQRLRAIIDASPVPSTLQDSKHRITYVNGAFTRIFGYTAEEINTLEDRQRMMSAAYPDEQIRLELRNQWNERLESNRQGDDFEPMELRVCCKDGSFRTVLGQASYLEGQEDFVYLVTLSDVTELNSLLSRMKTLLDTASDGIHILDESGRIYEFSNSFARMLGYSREEIRSLKMPDWDVSVSAIDIETFFSHLIENPGAFETRFRRKDGSVIDVEINAKSIELDGRTLLYGSARDISERKVAELRIRQLADIVEFSGDAILRETLDGVIISWNKGAEKLFGYSEGEVLNRSIDMLMPDESTGEELNILEMIKKGETVSNYETQRLVKNGQLCDVSISVSPIYNERHEVVGASKIVRDISRLKESEERFRVLFAESPDAFMILEPGEPGVISDCNRAAEKLLGGSREQIIGSDLLQLSASVQSDGRLTGEVLGEMQAKILDSGTGRFEWIHKRFNGEDFWVDVSAAVIMMSGRQVLLVSWRDISEQKKTAQQLEATLNLLEIATSAAEMGIWVWEIASDVLIWDDQMYDLYKIAPEERTDRHSMEFWGTKIHPDDLDQLQSDLREFIKNQRDFDTVFRAVLPDGAIRFFEAAARVEQDEQGRVLRLVGTNRDVTSAKENELRLAESEAQFRQLFEENHSVMMIIDPETQQISAANQAAIEFYGYPDDELIGMPLRQLNVASPDLVTRGVAQAVWEGLRYFNYKHRLASGEIRDVEIYVTPLKSGDSIRLFAIYHDVTARTRAQVALQEANRQIEERSSLLQHILDTVSVGVLLIDHGRIVTLANKRAAELFGRPVDSLVGIDYLTLIHPEMQAEVRQSVAAMLKMEVGPVHTERLFLRGDDTAFWGDVHAQVFILSDRSRPGIISSIADITLFKNAEVQLIRARDEAEAGNRSKSEFLANMSHEIRTPLNGVIGLTHLMQQTPLNARQEDYLRKINASSKALLGILNDILDYSKIEAGFMELEATCFYLDDLLTEISDLFSVHAEEKGLEFLFIVEPDVPQYLEGDLLRLRQVLSNLIGNAIKFTDKGEIRIIIELVTVDREVVRLKFSVSDTGMGISPEHQKRLFQAFQQADGSTTRRFGGTGLGLSISRKIVEIMGGEIGVISSPGEGSTFSFVVPLTVRNDVPMLRNPANLRGMRVLVVDDQQSSLMVMQQILESWSFSVTTAADGEQAILEFERALKDKKPFELLILDWKMPEMDGLEIAEKLHESIGKEIGTEPPIIIMATAFGREQARAIAGRMLFDAILDKPVTSSQLFDLIVDIQYGKKTKAQMNAAVDQTVVDRIFGAIAGAKILLVEDNKVNQQVASELLTGFGLQVMTADDGVDALQFLEHEEFDAVLLDLQMPRMDGYETTRQIRRLDSGRDLPIIAMTAAALVQDREACLAAGMNDHISKPIEPNVLAATLKKWIRPTGQAGAAAVMARSASTKETGTPFSLSGFNVTETAARMGGNWHALRKALTIFHDEFRDTRRDLLRLLDGKRYEDAARILHTIKGASGNMGAEKLYEASTRLHDELKEGDCESLQQFLMAYDEAMATLATLNSRDSAIECYNGEKAEEAAAILLELRTVLSEQRIVPEQLLTDLDGLAAAVPDGHLISRLQRQIDGFDYEAALTTIAALESALEQTRES